MPANIKAGDVMRKSVVTVNPQSTVDAVVDAMVDLDIGSVIVAEKHKPVGIITDSNLLERVFSKHKDPRKLQAEEVMSHPIRTVEPDTDIEEVTRIMRDLGVKRLPVTSNNKLVGIITETDIIAVSPALFELARELTEIRIGYTGKRSGTYTGICERCGEYSEDLNSVESMLVCPECRGA